MFFPLRFGWFFFMLSVATLPLVESCGLASIFFYSLTCFCSFKCCLNDITCCSIMYPVPQVGIPVALLYITTSMNAMLLTSSANDIWSLKIGSRHMSMRCRRCSIKSGTYTFWESNYRFS